MISRLPSPVRVAVTSLAIIATGAAACDGDDEISMSATSESDPAADDSFPSIRDVVAEQNADGTWSFAVTVSSPYDTPERYADGWRVVGPEGTVFGVHTLAHDHGGEQPFTRTQTGVEIPDDVDEVTIEGRDLVNGFGGETRTIELEAGTS